MLFDKMKEMAKLDLPLDDGDVNQCLADMQTHIGVDDGGYAGVLFSSVEDGWEKLGYEGRLEFLKGYIKSEIDFNVHADDGE